MSRQVDALSFCIDGIIGSYPSAKVSVNSSKNTALYFFQSLALNIQSVNCINEPVSCIAFIIDDISQRVQGGSPANRGLAPLARF